MTIQVRLAISIEFLRKLMFEKEIEIIFKARGTFGEDIFLSRVEYDFSGLLLKIIPKEKYFKGFKHWLSVNPRCALEIDLKKLTFTKPIIVTDLITEKVDLIKYISIECKLNYINNEEKYFKIIIMEIKYKDKDGKIIAEIMKGV